MNASFLRPAGCPHGVEPAQWRQAVTDRLEELSTAMTSLIEALDRMDGDADFEFNGDEMDLSAPEGWRPFDTSLLDDSEAGETDEDADPMEPMLGSPEQNPHTNTADQMHWSAGRNSYRLDDAEDENEHGGDIQDGAHDEARDWASA